MSLIRYDSGDIRGPSTSLARGLVDWTKGAAATTGGQVDFDDFIPYIEQGYTTDPSSSEVTVADQRFGVITVFEAAGSNETAGVKRTVPFRPDATPELAFGARVDFESDADSPQMFVGLTDVAVGSIWSSGALAVSSNQDMLGLRWNADETIDIVANVDGTLTVLKDDIGVSVERTDGFAELGLRVEKQTPSLYRLVPVVNGAVARSGIVNVANTAIPEDEFMTLAVAATVATTTDVDFDVDWIFAGDR